MRCSRPRCRGKVGLACAAAASVPIRSSSGFWGSTMPGASDLTTQVLAGDRRALPGLVRMSFGVFSTEKDVDAAADLLGQIAREGLRGTYRYDDEAGEY